MNNLKDYIIEKFKLNSHNIKDNYPFENNLNMDQIKKVYTDDEIKQILDTGNQLDKDPDEVYNVSSINNIIFKYYHDKSHIKYSSIGIYKKYNKFAVVLINKSKNFFVYPLSCNLETGEGMFNDLDDCLNCLIENQNKIIGEL